GERGHDGARQPRRVLHALPAGAPRPRGDGRRDGRPAVDRLRHRREPAARAEGAARAADRRDRTGAGMTDRARKVVLAYSGGLVTSIILPWRRENRGLVVHCVAGAVGQGAAELEGLEAMALRSGAASCKVVDLRREFLEDAVWPCLRALAVYEGRYLL